MRATIIFKLYQNYEPDNNLVIILVSSCFPFKIIILFCTLHIIILKDEMSVVQNLLDLKTGAHNILKILVIINNEF